MKETLWSSLAPSVCRYKEKFVTWKRALSCPCWYPDLGLPACRTVRESWLFTDSPVGHTAARAD